MGACVSKTLVRERTELLTEIARKALSKPRCPKSHVEGCKLPSVLLAQNEKLQYPI